MTLRRLFTETSVQDKDGQLRGCLSAYEGFAAIEDEKRELERRPNETASGTEARKFSASWTPTALGADRQARSSLAGRCERPERRSRPSLRAGR